MSVLVTGSSGLIGSAAVRHWDALGEATVGVDNDMRATFFGPAGSTRWNLQRLQAETSHYRHETLDIRDRQQVLELFRRDREWNDAAAKQQLFTIFEALKPNDPIVLNGRRKLSSMIFA